MGSDLRSRLDAVRRRWRAEVVLRAVGRAAAAAALPLLAALVVVRVLAPGDGALTLLVTTMCLAAMAAAVVILVRLPRPPHDTQIARFIEERVAAQPDLPPLDDVLVSAVSGDETSGEADGFRAFVREAAWRRLAQVELATIVPTEALRRAALHTAGGTALLVVAVVLAWPVLARATESIRIALFPQTIQVSVLPGDTRVASGTPLAIRAAVRANGSLLTRFTPRLTVTAGGAERVVAMTPDGDGFQFAFESVDRTFRYRVTAGSARSQEYTVTALVAPRVQRIDVHYDYPAFANLPPRDESDAGDIYAPAGTKVRVRIHTDKPVTAGQLTLAGTARSELRRTDAQVLEADLTLTKDDSYRIGLTDADGLPSAGDTEYFIRVMDDRPPTVRILRPAADAQITPLEEVAIEARADDDHGLARFELVYAVGGREPKVMPFRSTTGNELSKVGTHVIAAEDLGVQPGDVITYYARARDIGRGKRPSETRSDMFFLEVRPFSEEFVAAQSAVTGMAGEQIDALITAQKEIISATWNIERRATAGAGRSHGDVTAIAGAQAELKARVEQMASGSRGRPMRMPQQIGLPPQAGRGPRTGPDPVGAAITAMGRAIDQLHGQRTSDALPHEMSALRGLLQAQAEIRRREVSQQMGSAMGGLGRQGQDLSALFDKELQRQQRTNYETRPSAEQPPARPDNQSALDRIRDLARREEELSRKLRELAQAQVPPEELKRQLERLTREQEEMREQAEQMARQLNPRGQSSEQDQQSQPQPSPSGQQGQSAQQGQAGQPGQPGEQRGQSPRSGSSPSAQSGGGEMRQATEQMRSASSELQRQAPSSAADRAARAAAQLRKLEQQMRGDSPEARQRAAGELQLEAQQIADEQRRIAGEAERLDKSGSGDADAWRRLAGEKDKLADRVDELQRATERVAGTDKAGGRPSAGEGGTRDAAAAATELQRQQVAGRMRDTAKQMREGADPSGAGAPGRSGKPSAQARAGAEQQIARALDQVVDKLGGARGEADALARQLDDTRSLRDGLDRLERQVREAESRAAQSTASGARQGRGSAPGSGGGDDELQRLRQEYARQLQRAREAVSRLERRPAGPGVGGTSPEEHEWSPTDQGFEAFKQDFSKWESLRKDVDSALERYEASIVAAAARKSLQDRLSAGGSDRVPDAYRTLIARYYEALARKK